MVTTSVLSSGRPRAGGKHRKVPPTSKATARHRLSLAELAAACAVVFAVVVALVIAGAVTQRAAEAVRSDIGVDQRPPPPVGAPEALPRREIHGNSGGAANPAPFASDNRGFLASAARCSDAQSAYVIGRTPGSLIVICGGQPGRYVYVGLRLSDAAVLRTGATPDSARGFVAQRAAVRYAVSPTELRVTSGATVIKDEPMLDYRVLAR